MRLRQNIRLSLHRQVSALLSGAGYLVLGEDDLVRANQGASSPSVPYVFLLHAPVDPLAGPVRPPAVVMALEFSYHAHELGSRSFAAAVEAGFLVLAASRADRDDLCDLLASGLKTLTVLDFGTDPPTPLATVDVEEPIESTPLAVPEELARQGALRFAEEVTVSFTVYLPG